MFGIRIHRSLLLVLGLASLSTTVEANLIGGCVPDGEYDATVDYFPDKVEVRASKFWEIDYFNNYKKVKNEIDGEIFILYQCGTPMPSFSGVDLTHIISIPLQDGIAMDTTTHIPYMELLGLRTEIKAWMGSSNFISSPCLKQMIDDDEVVLIPDTNDQAAVDSLKDVLGPNVVSFHNNRAKYPSELLNVTLGAYKEASNPEIFEWMKFMAAFFNVEAKANELFDAADSRYECTSNEAEIIAARSNLGDGVQPVVLWASWTSFDGTEGWQVGTCPNYYCEFAADCAADIITSRSGTIDFFGSLLLTTEAFVAEASEADYWIYPSFNWDSTFELHKDVLMNFKSVQNQQVFDNNGAGASAWFENRLAEYDLVLQDFCDVVGTADPRHERIWFRNVFTESQHENEITTCEDPSAPLVPRFTPCAEVNICFSGDTTVRVDSTTTKQMKDLKIGDTIQTGVQSYEKIYGFGHWQSDQKASYLQLHTNCKSSPLEISEQHLVYTAANTRVPVVAKSLKLGDKLLLASDENSSCGITKITKIVKNGAYAPFTASGKLVVNGIVASSYVSLTGNSYYLAGLVSHHWLAHVLTTPLRFFCKYGECNHTYNTDGVWTSIPLDFVQSMLSKSSMFYQVLILIPLILINLSLMAIETMLTTSFGFFGVLTTAAMLLFRRSSKKISN